MNAAVGLVEAYLHANGYLTLTQYPIIEALGEGGYRAVTDIDLLAIRLPGAGRIVPHEVEGAAGATRVLEPDPALLDDSSDERADLIIAEVKEGRAELNRGAREPSTLITAIRRVTFVEERVAERLGADLVRTGSAITPDGRVRIRLFAFAGRPPKREPEGYSVVLLRHCIDHLLRTGEELSHISRAAEIQNPTLSLLNILRQTGACASPGDAGR